MKKKEVKGRLGKVDELKVIGFVLTKGTFGARIKVNSKRGMLSLLVTEGFNPLLF